mmetsp:Transcript_30086/g.96263  ORF Transcript_30086/g.96263 Transcript_30086/m.96263 type:complete len:195 (+) Transcript_30086:67-651(+)
MPTALALLTLSFSSPKLRSKPSIDERFIFKHMAERLQSQSTPPPDAAVGVLRMKVGRETWQVDAAQCKVVVCKGGVCPVESDVQAVVDAETLAALLARHTSPIAAVLQKKLRLAGDTALLRSMGWLWEVWKLDMGTEGRPGPIWRAARVLHWAAFRAPSRMVQVPLRGTLRALRWTSQTANRACRRGSLRAGSV